MHPNSLRNLARSLPDSDCAAKNDLPMSKNEAHQDATYEVGYCRPPKRHQWKPGQTGNPRGERANLRRRAELRKALYRAIYEADDRGNVEQLVQVVTEALREGSLKDHRLTELLARHLIGH